VTTKDDKTGPQEKGKQAASDIQVAGQRAVSTVVKGFVKTWKLYRQSKTGVAGLAIAVGFLVVAVFAPWLAPYDSDFKAPAIDTFIADYVSRNLTSDLSWSKIIGLTSATRDHPLERVLAYSDEGAAMVYPVTYGISEETGQIGIVVDSPSTVNLPAHATYLTSTHFSTSFLFALNETPGSGGTSSTLYEYSYVFDYKREHLIPFVPKYHSNLWNGYSFVVQDARLALAFADDHALWMINKRPASVFEPGTDSVSYINNITISNATIIGNPLVVDGDFENGSMVFVPTDMGIMAYSINVTKHNVTMRVLDISIGGLAWMRNYSIGEEAFEPVAGNNMLAFQYPYSPSTPIGKEWVAVASTDGRVVAYDRVTGNSTWSNKLILTGIRDFEISGLFSSPDYLVMVGKTGERGIMAGLVPETGRVGNNNTMFSTVDGYIDSEPQYVPGQLRYVFSTEKGTIYLVTNLMRINATFSAPNGGAVTPVAFVGNIYIEMTKTGNYFAVVTQENTLFMETLTGVNIAPLPPGTYPSGNYYPLGTDYEGHDILTQVMFGTRAELLVGITAAFFSVVVGTIVGLVAGFYSGFVDDLLMRITDVMLSLPYLVIMLLFAAAFGPSLFNIIIIFAILSWAGIARVIRSVTLSIKERAFVDAAIVSGASDSRLIFRHIGPNVLPYTFLYMTFNISGAIVTEAILAFLGFGDPNSITWGMMLQFLQISGHALDAPWWLLPPGIAITLLSLAFYLIGRAFDEVVNPRLRKR
jgi:peptide/nickel transport system permease protein